MPRVNLKMVKYLVLNLENIFLDNVGQEQRKVMLFGGYIHLIKNGIRIATTPRKLLESLYKSAGQFKDINSFIGKVNYYTTPKLKELLANHAAKWIIDSSGAGQAQTLLFKRTPFKHENEVRIIFNSHGNEKTNLYRFPVNPIDLIDDIVFDPRIDYSEFSSQKKLIRKMGFTKRIVKSNLYKVQNLKFNFNQST